MKIIFLVLLIFILLFGAHLIKAKTKDPTIIALTNTIVVIVPVIVSIILALHDFGPPPPTSSTSNETTSNSQPYKEEITSNPTTDTTEEAKSFSVEIDLSDNRCILVSNGEHINTKNIEWHSSNENVAICNTDMIELISEGETIISAIYNGEKIDNDIRVTILKKEGQEYDSEKEEIGENKVLIKKSTQYQYYRYVCNKCGYRDCYGKSVCKESYPMNSTCTGEFTELETIWSDINPEDLKDHSFVGIKSIPPEKDTGKEWYWFPEFSGSHNEIRTIYTYVDITYYISSYSEI